jgi:hypothetical protein
MTALRFGGRLAAVLLRILPMAAQSVPSRAATGRTLLTVPVTGRGTWDDPKRPAFVKEAGVAFQFTLSDDGTMAIVEASPRTLAELRRLTDLVAKEPRAKLFLSGKDNGADVLNECKRLKKDFDPEVFGKPGFAVKPRSSEAAQ